MLKDDNQEQKISVIDYAMMQENIDYNEKQRIEKLYKDDADRNNGKRKTNFFIKRPAYVCRFLLLANFK